MRGPVPEGSTWGKLEQANDEVVAWHPLIDHCVDVACVAEALLTHTLLGARLAHLAGHASLDQPTIARLCVLAGLHDLGKANRGFQKRGRVGTAPLVGHVREGLALLLRNHPRRKDLGEALRATSGWEVARLNLPLLRAAIAHHGRYVQPDMLYQEHWGPAQDDPLGTVTTLAARLVQAFPACLEAAASLPPAAIHDPDDPDGDDEPTYDHSFVHGWAGLVMLADWLGSDRGAFPYTEPGDPDREVTARPSAKTLLAKMGLIREARPKPPSTFREVTGRTPRPAQAALFTHPMPDGPSVVVLEAETGSGKTEAAFAHFARLYADHHVDGMYFAVPTRAAASQLHRRIVRLTQDWFGSDAPPVVLAVPGLVRVDDTSPAQLSRFEFLWNDDPTAQDRHRYWAAENSKRYLAGAIAVGTVDQVLLSALRENHAHLRASSLLRQLLVVDEVHASDRYMTTLLEEVLRRHWRAGGHALLLSATLESVRREELLCRASGKPFVPVPVEVAQAEAYPRLSAAGGETSTIEATGEGKAVAMRSVAWMADPNAIAQAAVDAARSGARVLVLRNTVRGCLEVQAEVERIGADVGFRCQGVLAPHHSRFAPEDRHLLDRCIELRLSPTDNDEGGVVCVATQTVEQSLDIDADLLIADLCPVDVLLQRIGRLHRHVRQGRPEPYRHPQCVVLRPAQPVASLWPGTRHHRGVHGLGTVYQHLGVLEATLREVDGCPIWDIPRDNRRLVEQCLHPQRVTALCAELGLLDHHHEVNGTEAAKQKIAATFGLWDPTNTAIEACGIGADDAYTSTRWTEDESEDRLVPVSCTSPFGNRLTQLRVPGFFLPSVPLDAPVRFTAHAGGLTLQVGDAVFVYDHRGLRTEP